MWAFDAARTNLAQTRRLEPWQLRDAGHLGQLDLQVQGWDAAPKGGEVMDPHGCKEV